MTTPSSLDPALRVALAYTPVAHRPRLAALLEFDTMLGRFVSRGSEPLLIQVRLAWWREQLQRSDAAAEPADPVLAGLRSNFAGEKDLFVALVDGWEGLVGTPPFGADAIGRLAKARAQAIGVFAARAGAPSEIGRAESAGMAWALADIAGRSGPAGEIEAIGSFTPVSDGPLPQRSALRGIAVLGGLGRRALRRGEPLFHGKRAALAAFRLGLLGR